jgi:hypothetical protein
MRERGRPVSARRRLGTLAALLVSIGAPAALLTAAAGAGPLGPALRVTITARPPATSTSSKAAFEFSANEPATFTCSLDGARPSTCASPKDYTDLADGAHVFDVTVRNSDRAGSYTAEARYRWTIDVPEAPPPPPPPPPTPPPPPPPVQQRAALLVDVIGGGSVTGAGISCPGDCNEAVAVGSQIALQAAARSGFAFHGWSGACGGNGACAAAVGGPTYVRAVFVRSASPPALAGDADGDGLTRRTDLCPATDPRWKPVAEGCSPTDLLRDASPLLDELHPPGEATSLVRRHPRLKPAAAQLVASLHLFDAAAEQLAGGDVCGGAALARRGARGLGVAAGKARGLIGGLQRTILKRPPGKDGDTDAKEFEWAALHYAVEQDLGTVTGGQAAALQFAALCRGLGKPRSLVGRIESIDDTGGLLELDDGVVVVFRAGDLSRPLQIGQLWPGARIRVMGRKLQDGPVVADSIAAAGDASVVQVPAKPCVSMLVAPAQDFTKQSLVLHDPRGYQDSAGGLWLEDGARLAASPKCADAKPSTTYSLEIEASSPGSSTKLVAASLTPGHAPVPLTIPPSPGGSPKTWTITVTYRRQGFNCPPNQSSAMRIPAGAAISYPCPVVVMATKTYEARVRPAAFYATAKYERTIFDLESNGFASARVVGLTAVHPTIANPGFAAEGYKIQGTQSAGFLSTIGQNQQFAVWPQAWFGFPQASPLQSIGVDHYAALEWPRVTGQRHGKPFRYRAALPTISTDLLPGCGGGQNCLYRLPWLVNTVVKVGQGNNSPGTASHCCPPQNFAFDLSMPDKSTIYATRGGIVGDVVESNTMNFNPCADNNGNGIKGDADDQKADGPSNYVRIDHTDGTYSYYAHVDTNSVTPSVGDTIERGDALAKVDNIGRSCGPHLHYQVSIDNTKTIYGQTTQICFEAIRVDLQGPNLTFSPCYVPTTGDFLGSTNG